MADLAERALEVVDEVAQDQVVRLAAHRVPAGAADPREFVLGRTYAHRTEPLQVRAHQRVARMPASCPACSSQEAPASSAPISASRWPGATRTGSWSPLTTSRGAA